MCPIHERARYEPTRPEAECEGNKEKINRNKRGGKKKIFVSGGQWFLVV
jgi:hypothetical protein